MQMAFEGHGFDAHSSTLISQRRPVNPGEHVQVKLKEKIHKFMAIIEPLRYMHVAETDVCVNVVY